MMDLSVLDPALEQNIHVLSPEARIELFNAIMRRLGNLVKERLDLLGEFSPNVKKRVVLLMEIQLQHDEYRAKFLEERATLEAKYLELYEPLYARRYEIVNGIEEVEDVKYDAKGKAPVKDNFNQGVPGFWFISMKNNELLAKEIQQRDEGALEYLIDIKWCRVDEPRGFKLGFFFDSNPYFKNLILTKTYEMADEDDQILKKVIGTEIEWHHGMCLSQIIMNKKPKKGSKTSKRITKIEKCESFFNFFNPPEVLPDDVRIKMKNAEKLQNQMEHDYEIAITIRDKIIPRAISWFIGDIAPKINLEDLKDEDDDKKKVNNVEDKREDDDKKIERGEDEKQEDDEEEKEEGKEEKDKKKDDEEEKEEDKEGKDKKEDDEEVEEEVKEGKDNKKDDEEVKEEDKEENDMKKDDEEVKEEGEEEKDKKKDVEEVKEEDTEGKDKKYVDEVKEEDKEEKDKKKDGEEVEEEDKEEKDKKKDNEEVKEEDKEEKNKKKDDKEEKEEDKEEKDKKDDKEEEEDDKDEKDKKKDDEEAKEEYKEEKDKKEHDEEEKEEDKEEEGK